MCDSHPSQCLGHHRCWINIYQMNNQWGDDSCLSYFWNRILLLFLLSRSTFYYSSPIFRMWKWKSLSHVQLCNPMDYTAHGIRQARILEWAVCPFSRGSSQPRDRTQVSHIAGEFFTSWATKEFIFYFWWVKFPHLINPLHLPSYVFLLKPLGARRSLCKLLSWNRKLNWTSWNSLYSQIKA